MNARRGIAVLGITLALAACSEGEKPAGSLPQLTSTPSATPSAASSVPSFPATRAGAEAFVRAWVQAMNEAGRTGSTSKLAALSDPACRSCSGLVSYFKTAWAHGRLVGGDVTLTNVVAAPVTGEEVVVTADFHFAAERRYDSAGHLVHSQPASVEGEKIRLLRRGDGWVMRAMTELN